MHAVHSAKVIKITFAQCYITTKEKMKKKRSPEVLCAGVWRELGGSSTFGGVYL
jgi:hypothetical protein